MGSKFIITVDTEVSRMKGKMPVSIWWFIPSIIISIIPIVIALNNVDIFGMAFLFISLTSIIVTTVFIIMYKVYTNQKTEVYSEDSKVNLICNTIYKRYYTLGCICAATI
ncbi:hypothetical protein GNF51_16560, partial [Clostridium perfringens]|uniref:hypothetical protein n=1 Tax=Clostridium perfringens TaxID=1502 RepID=UPI002AC5B1E9